MTERKQTLNKSAKQKIQENISFKKSVKVVILLSFGHKVVIVGINIDHV